MSALLNFSLEIDKISKSKIVVGKNGKKYYNLTLSVNDQTNQYGQNVSVFDSQSEEERKAKKQKDYLGNGKVVWTDGKIVKAEQQGSSAPKQSFQPQADDLPF